MFLIPATIDPVYELGSLGTRKVTANLWLKEIQVNPHFFAAPLVMLSFGLAGCDMNIQSCSNNQVCVSQGQGERIVGSGTIRTEARTVGSFTTVRLQGAGRVVIESGDTDGVTVTGDDNVLPKITTVTRNGVLVLGITANTNIVANELIYRVTARDLREIDANGAGTIEATKLMAKAFAVMVAGSSSVRLSGKVTDLKLAISGSGTIDAARLPADRANIVLSGSGNTSVDVRESLDAVISGSGSATYAGMPKVHSTVSGSGSLKHSS